MADDLTTRTLIKRVAKDTATLRRTWRKLPNSLTRPKLREEILKAFSEAGFPPHETFNFLAMVEGLDPWIRFLDMMRDDMVARRMMNIMLGVAANGEGGE